MTSIDRTAYARFRGLVSARESVEGFTPTPDEAACARGKATADQAFLALLTWLKCYQRLRCFPTWTRSPRSSSTTYALRWDHPAHRRPAWSPCGRPRDTATTYANVSA